MIASFLMLWRLNQRTSRLAAGFLKAADALLSGGPEAGVLPTLDERTAGRAPLILPPVARLTLVE